MQYKGAEWDGGSLSTKVAGLMLVGVQRHGSEIRGELDQAVDSRKEEAMGRTCRGRGGGEGEAKEGS